MYIDASHLLLSDHTIKFFLLRKGDFRKVEDCLIRLLTEFSEVKNLKVLHLLFLHRSANELRSIDLGEKGTLTLILSGNKSENEGFKTLLQQKEESVNKNAVFVLQDHSFELDLKSFALVKPKAFVRLVKEALGEEKFKAVFN